MKDLKISILLCLGFFSLTSAQEGWIWQNPLPQGADMFAVIPLSPDKAVITGSGGTMVATQDGGKNWNIQRLPQVDWVRIYSFISENEGWIISNWYDISTHKNVSKIFKTNNSGLTWEEINLSIDIDFSVYRFDGIAFVNDQIGFLLANPSSTNPNEQSSYPGLIYKTDNGGKQWYSVDIGIQGKYNQLVFIDSKKGFLLSQPYSSGSALGNLLLYKTTDGGNTWASIIGEGYGRINFVNDHTGWAGNYKTTDGGETWSLQQFNFPPSEHYVDVIWFADSLTGYAIRYNEILKTEDGGNSWSVQTVTTNGLLQDIKFYNSKIGYTCGYGGTIYRTSDGGENWIRVGEGVTNDLTDIEIIDENTGWAVGYYGTILHTSNGGSTWKKQNVPEECDSAFFRGVDFTDSQNGWITGDQYILSTEDGGINWNIQLRVELDDLTGRMRDIKFLNKDTGFAVGQKSMFGPGMLYLTTNAGNIWKRVDDSKQPPLDEIFFVDNDYGWICGNGVLLSTTDGGYNWYTDYVPEFLRYMQFTDRDHGWISSLDEGAVFRTTDGGKTWTDIPYGNRYNQFFNSFFFFNNDQGIASTFLFNIILTTNNGGLNWYKEEILPPARMNAMKFINDSVGWVVGTNGSILKRKGSYFNTTNVSLPITVLNNYKSEFSNYPNPFNSSTTISFYLSKPQDVSISIYDLTGRCILTYNINNTHEGKNEINWQPRNLGSGIYFAKISCNEYSKIIKCLLLK